MGSINARMSKDDNRFYNVNRDTAHNFDQVVMEVAKRCEEGTWPELHALAKAHNASDEDLGLACAALCRFMAVQADDPKESMAACLSRCGWLDLPALARIVVTAYIGVVSLGIHWAGVRESTVGDQSPVLSYKKLRWHGLAFSKLMRLPRWKRKLYRLRQRLRRAWRAFKGAGVYDG